MSVSSRFYLQEKVTSWLRGEYKLDPLFVRSLAKRLQDEAIVRLSDLPRIIREQLATKLFPKLSEDWYDAACIEILKESIEIRDDHHLVIKNLRGRPLHSNIPYGLREYRDSHWRGESRLRTTRFAQPGALRKGDILATGETVISAPREGGNGSVLIQLSGVKHGVWLALPGRIAVALLAKEEKEAGLLNNDCLCPKECDCQGPPPENWDGREGCYHVSNYCPKHNEQPWPMEGCPVHLP